MRSGGRHPRGARSPAFLLAQVGAHASAMFAERLAAIDLTPSHAGILRAIDAGEGPSQQALCAILGIAPSRLVTLLDELERKKLIERRNNPEDRRLYALYLTEKGRETLKAIAGIAREHGNALCAALNAAEREQLSELLRRIADQQGLTPGVHPGFRR